MIVSIMVMNIVLIALSIYLIIRNSQLARMIIESHKANIRGLDMISGQINFVDGKIPPRKIPDGPEY